ncbi:hypothetical protein PG988_015407 [Apiospora saccharicola]
MGDRLSDFRFGVRDMAIDLQWIQQSILSKLEERSKLPWFSYSMEKMMLPSERRLRKQWIADTINLKETLGNMVLEAEAITNDLQHIAKALKAVEHQMTTSQQAQMEKLKRKERHWLFRLDMFGTPVSIYESDIEMIDSFIPEIDGASRHVLEVQKNMKSAYNSLIKLEDKTLVDKGVDLLHGFGHHQFHAHQQLSVLVKAIDDESGPIKEKTTATVTVTATPVPSDSPTHLT